LDDVSFDVCEGTFTALIGPNGAGKSTCLKLLLGLVRPEAGRVEVFGEDPGFGARGIGYVPQSVEIPKGFPISVEEVALMGRYGVLGPGRRPKKDDRERVRFALEQVHLADLAPRRFQDLSGGQQQRALIARALCGEPRLLQKLPQKLDKLALAAGDVSAYKLSRGVFQVYKPCAKIDIFPAGPGGVVIGAQNLHLRM